MSGFSLTRSHRIIVFVVAFVGALILMLPLGLAIRWAGADRAGMTARSASGDVWTGRLQDVRIGTLKVGEAYVGLKPLPLLTGQADLGADTQIGFGYLVASGATQGLRRTTAKLPLAAVLAPLPVDELTLTDATIIFRGDACAEAQGQARASFSGTVGGLALSQGMAGVLRCEGQDLLIPLVSQSAMEKLMVRMRGSGRWSAVFTVQPGDPALSAKLQAAGFTNAGGVMVLRLSGQL